MKEEKICGNCLYDYRCLGIEVEPCKTCCSDDGEDKFIKETRTVKEYFSELKYLDATQ